MANKDMQKWALLVGLIIAIVAAFVSFSWVPLILFVVGLIVGFLNIDDKETMMFLVAVIALGAIGSQSVSVLSSYVGGFASTLGMMINNVIAFVGAAGLVVAIKAIIAIGRD